MDFCRADHEGNKSRGFPRIQKLGARTASALSKESSHATILASRDELANSLKHKQSLNCCLLHIILPNETSRGPGQVGGNDDDDQDSISHS